MGEEQFKGVFVEEALEHLTLLENALMELEETPDNMELVDSAFRSMHTLKGSGAMFGFDVLSHFTHDIETVYDLVRSGSMKITQELIDLTFCAKDEILCMLRNDYDTIPEVQKKKDELTKEFKDLIERYRDGGNGATAKGTLKKPDGKSIPDEIIVKDIEAPRYTYRIRYRPCTSCFLRGTNPLLNIEELAGFGRASIVAHMDDIKFLDEYDPDACYAYWDIIVTTEKEIDAIKDVFAFEDESSEVKIEVIDVSGELDGGDQYKKLGEILLEKGDLTQDDLDSVLGLHKKLGELLVEKGVVNADIIEAALAEQVHIREEKKSQQTSVEETATIRVPADRLDTLVNLVGELVTVQAHLTQMAVKRIDYELLNVAEEVERLTCELRDNTMNIRMLPIGTTFDKFKRLVRDLSKELKKEIILATEGAQTELDKTVIEKLNDPLVHIIRNSIDHGVETPEQRKKVGKPPKGTITLSAIHSGSHVLIRVKDDGKGLDVEAIKNKAIERGLISANAELSDSEIFSFIFAPGFSTAKEVTSVSGRGVGMDVVKRGIESLRGSIGIESARGVGTTITVKLPLTLAIIDGLLVRAGAGSYVLPLTSVLECIAISKDEIDQNHGRELTMVRGQIIPYISLREHFFINSTEPVNQQIIICEVNARRVGVLVDQVIGEHQTVIKNLGGIYKNVETLSGATILGDGSVALILDVNRLVNLVEGVERDAVKRLGMASEMSVCE
ncbi:chemotaxis protein CheW [Candidatus Magnetominusculus dajiuhuensis]|uniref:chemotaxis protein CheA n=1 Tax=Candidatus Magnetominusculus dajiuhuensis TaxID=3137712 RepID=UPI003B435304